MSRAKAAMCLNSSTGCSARVRGPAPHLLHVRAGIQRPPVLHVPSRAGPCSARGACAWHRGGATSITSICPINASRRNFSAPADASSADKTLTSSRNLPDDAAGALAAARALLSTSITAAEARLLRLQFATALASHSLVDADASDDLMCAVEPATGPAGTAAGAPAAASSMGALQAQVLESADLVLGRLCEVNALVTSPVTQNRGRRSRSPAEGELADNLPGGAGRRVVAPPPADEDEVICASTVLQTLSCWIGSKRWLSRLLSERVEQVRQAHHAPSARLSHAPPGPAPTTARLPRLVCRYGTHCTRAAARSSRPR